MAEIDLTPKIITLHGYPLTERMKLFGVTGMMQTLGGGWDIQTATGSATAPHEVALWFMEQDAALKQRLSHDRY